MRLKLLSFKRSNSSADKGMGGAIEAARATVQLAAKKCVDVRLSLLTLEANIESSRTLTELCKESKADEASSRIRGLGCLDYATDEQGNSPLHLATFQNDLSLMYLLLSKGADPNIENYAQYTPMSIAQLLGLELAQTMLLKHGATDLHTKVESKEEAGIQVLLSPAELILATESLQAAAFRGLTWHVTSLVDGQNIDEVDQRGSTLLMRAAKMGHLDLVNQLCQKGADLNIVDTNRFDALTWACLSGWKTIVERLLAGNASINVINSETNGKRCSPLIAACYGGHTEVVEFLLAQGADVNYTTQNGATALMISSWMIHGDIVAALIKQKAAESIPPYTKWYQAGSEHKLRYNQYYAHLEITSLRAAGVVLEQMLQIEQQLVETSPDKDALPQGYVSSIPTKLAKRMMQEMEADIKHEQKRKEAARLSHRGQLLQARQLELKSVLQKWIEELPCKQLGEYRALITPILYLVPMEGSELDSLFIDVVSEVIQLSCLANQNEKQQYITLAAKITDTISSILDLIRIPCKIALPASASLLKPQTTPTGLTTGSSAPSVPLARSRSSERIAPPIVLKSSAENGTDVPFILSEAAYLKPKMDEQINMLKNDRLANLLKHTRLASGVWPPPMATNNMVKAACETVQDCKILVELGNLTSHWARYELSRDNLFGVMSPVALNDSGNNKSEIKPTLHGQPLDFANYKRQNDMKVMDELSKQPRPTNEADTSKESEEETDQPLFAAFDRHTTQFVAAIRSLKGTLVEGKKTEYSKLCSQVYSCLDAVVYEAKNYHILVDAPKHLRIEDKAQTIPGALNGACDALMIAGNELTLKGALAAGVWPSPNANQDVTAAMTTCITCLKTFTATVKELCAIIRNDVNVEKVQRQEWRQRRLEGNKVKQLFLAWDISQQGKTIPKGDSRILELSAALTEKDKEMLSDSDEGILIVQDDADRPYIKGGRLLKLVERLTHHQYSDQEYNQDFLLTHHSFTTSQGLLDLLIQRYDMMPPYGLDARAFDLYISAKLFPVRSRILETLRFWMESYFADFFADEMAITRKLKQFLVSRAMADFPGVATDLIKLMTDKISKSREVNGPYIPNSISIYAGGPDIQAQNNEWIHNVAPEEFAKQLCCVEMAWFESVEPKEFINQIWGRVSESSQKKAPNLDKLIGLTNRVTRWIAKCILSATKLKTRISVIKYFITVATESRRLNDFNGLTTIVAGLSVGPVRRLEVTWQAFEHKYPKLIAQYQQLEEAVSTSGQYANYRRVLKTVEKPAIPFLGVYITDLTFIEDGNPDFLPKVHFINMDKRRKVAKVINEITAYQQSKYDLERNPTMAYFFSNVKLCEDAELFALSLKAEALKDDSGDDDDD